MKKLFVLMLNNWLMLHSYYNFSSHFSCRETFDNQEMEILTQKINSLGSMQRQLDETWKPLRWVWDLISVGRDKNHECGVAYKNILEWFENNAAIAQITDENNPNMKSWNIKNTVENIIQDIPINLSNKGLHGRNVAIPIKKSTIPGQLAEYVSQNYCSKSSLPASLSSSPHLTRKSGLNLSHISLITIIMILFMDF